MLTSFRACGSWAAEEDDDDGGEAESDVFTDEAACLFCSRFFNRLRWFFVRRCFCPIIGVRVCVWLARVPAEVFAAIRDYQVLHVVGSYPTGIFTSTSLVHDLHVHVHVRAVYL